MKAYVIKCVDIKLPDHEKYYSCGRRDCWSGSIYKAHYFDEYEIYKVSSSFKWIPVELTAREIKENK